MQAADITAACQSALTAAGRSAQYRPFTQLRHLRTPMCWCTSPSVWHALLSLLRWAVHVHSVSYLSSNDPLVVSALGYLPSLAALGSQCLWPESFTNLIDQKIGQTTRYRFLASRAVSGDVCYGCPRQGGAFGLSSSEDLYHRELYVLLRPGADLFAAYRCSLGAEWQTLLARWARGEFNAADAQLSAAESPIMQCQPLLAQHCAHAHEFHSRTAVLLPDEQLPVAGTV